MKLHMIHQCMVGTFCQIAIARCMPVEIRWVEIQELRALQYIMEFIAMIGYINILANLAAH